MSKTKDNIFRPSASWLSRAGVVVSYGPEDTMKSMIREEQSSSERGVDVHGRGHHFEVTMRPGQLSRMMGGGGAADGKKEHAVSESEGEEDILTSEGEGGSGWKRKRESSSSYDETDEEETLDTIVNKRTVKFTLPQASISSLETSLTGKIQDSQEISQDSSQNQEFSEFENPSRSRSNRPLPSTEVEETAKAVSNEEQLKDFLDDRPDDRVCVGEQKTFDQILEEQLRLESEKSRSMQPPPRQQDSKRPAATNLSKKNTITRPGGRGGAFLRKNQGAASWNASRRLTGAPTNQKSPPLSSNQKSPHSGGKKQAGVRRIQNDQTANPVEFMTRTWTAQKTTHNAAMGDGDRMSATISGASATNNCGQPEIRSLPAKHGGPTSTHKSSTTRENFVPQPSTQLPSLSQSMSKEDIEKQQAAEELEEFELLEQVADTSFASSISTVARLDKNLLKERLQRRRDVRKGGHGGTFPDSSTASAGLLGSERHGGGPIDTWRQGCPRVLDNLSDVEDEDSFTEVQENNNSSRTDDKLQPSAGTNSRPRKVACFSERSPVLNERERFQDDVNWEQVEDERLHTNGPVSLPVRYQRDADSMAYRQEDTSSNQPRRMLHPSVYHHHKQEQQDVYSEGHHHQVQTNLSIHTGEDDIFDRAVQMFPKVTVDKSKANPEENSTIQAVNLRKWVEVLESEIKRFNNENAALAVLKKDREEAMKRMESEMKAFEEHRDKERDEFEAYKEAEMKKIRKEKKVFEEYQRAMKTMPNKKDREEIDRLKEELEEAREELSHKDSRWQMANNRLRNRVDQLEGEKEEMQTRVKVLEQRRLDLQSQLTASERANTLSKTAQQSRPSLNSVNQAISFKRAPTVVGSLCRPSSTTSTATTQKAGSHGSSGQAKNTNYFPSVVGDSLPTSATPNGLRGSTASGYYTGEEEASSNGSHTAHNRSSKDDVDFEMTTPQQATIKKYATGVKGKIKEEICHPDNILEKVYMSGAVEIFYPNGSIKEVSPDSQTMVVSLFNGDIKQILPDGRVVYYYAEEKTTQTTHTDGVEEIEYSDGRKEVSRPSGVREVYFPDQTVKYLHPDGREESIHANGMVVRTLESGDKEILLPNGQKEVHSGGCKRRVYPDGTTKTVFPDGRQETRYSSGRVRIKDREGNLIVDTRV